MARTRKMTCDVTVDNIRRTTGANKNQLRRMFTQINSY